MLLENINLSVTDVPQLEDRDFQNLESDYLYFRITGKVIFILMISGLASLFSLFGQLYFGYWLYPLLVILALTLLFEIVGFKFRGFSLRSRDISYRYGWLFHTMTTIPLNRVQHCEFTQGPLGRLFDLAAVKVYTAGGSTSDLIIKGLRKDNAIKLRYHITKLSSEYE
jgi:membrane protein YdbS with pleckstrin-like domain